ncbi:MAG: SDR family oxidoreductase [Marinilabiliaceae bacterium]|nr:SDR family oxidoreductase [Marinilabiliaceae bacterium]
MKTVFITGCSTGFGKVTAEFLAARGYYVLAGIRNTKTLNKQVVEELSGIANIEVIELDLSSGDSINSAVQIVKNRKIDVLVNNAGVCGIGFSEVHSVDNMKRIFEVNVFGFYELTRQIIPLMRQHQEGLIISVSSIVGRIVMPVWGAYSASKFAMEALAETWRYELKPLGIDSVIVEPGPHPTTGLGMKMSDFSSEMPSHDVLKQYGSVANSLQEFSEKLKQEMEEGIDQKPEGVANAIARLIEQPFGKRPMRTVVDRQLHEVLLGLNNYTDMIYQQIYS